MALGALPASILVSVLGNALLTITVGPALALTGVGAALGPARRASSVLVALRME